MSDVSDLINAVQKSHERFAAAVQPLDTEQITGPSYDTDWTIADVASHLGSQAEIFELFLDAGLSGRSAPGGEQFGPIWDRWNNLAPAEQVANSVAANETFVTRLAELDDDARSAFALSVFGRDQDLAGLATMRLGEHAVHTWDVAVALEPDAQIAADAVELLIDTLPGVAGRSGKPAESGHTYTVITSEPTREFVLTTGPEVTLAPGSAAGSSELRLPAEALFRLVYGRLDDEHTPDGIADEAVLDELRGVFQGF